MSGQKKPLPSGSPIILNPCAKLRKPILETHCFKGKNDNFGLNKSARNVLIVDKMNVIAVVDIIILTLRAKLMKPALKKQGLMGKNVNQRVARKG